ncbi:hypothetical protein EQ718_06160 [Paracoccus versutus]|nr:hypothetical protein EQ718_06160 [Paracoccus versutus]
MQVDSERLRGKRPADPFCDVELSCESPAAEARHDWTAKRAAIWTARRMATRARLMFWRGDLAAVFGASRNGRGSLPRAWRPGARVSDVARRHAVTRWQIYDWRKKLASGHLALTAETASEPMFAALVVAPPSAPVTGPRDGSVREAKSCLIELELDGVILRVRSDIDEAQLPGRSVPSGRRRNDLAERRPARLRCHAPDRLPQRHRRAGAGHPRDARPRSVQRRGFRVPGQARGPDQGVGLGPDRHGPGSQAARGSEVRPAPGAGWRDEDVSGPVCRSVRGPRLAACPS